VLSCAHDDDLAHLRALVDDPGTESVLCLVPVDVEPTAEVQELWHVLARRRFVAVLRHTDLRDGRARERSGVGDVLSAISSVARWAAVQDGVGPRLMALVAEPLPPHPTSSVPEMHGLAIRGNVEVATTTEGVSMTIAPDDPFAVPDPANDPDVEPSADPQVEPLEPQDPDDVPEVPQPPAPAPDETGIR
jgi:hypothetical protein